MDTFLPPIEKPGSFGMKLAYYFSRKYFGKVLTPLKVHSARLPAAFGMFYGKVSRLDKKLTLAAEMVLLLRVQVARLNVCLFCMDAARYAAVQASMASRKAFVALSCRVPVAPKFLTSKGERKLSAVLSVADINPRLNRAGL